MVLAKVKFSSTQDIIKFVNQVSKYKNIDIDIQDNNTVLDAKSINGLLSIELGKVVKCYIHESLENSSAIIADIQDYTLTSFEQC